MSLQAVTVQKDPLLQNRDICYLSSNGIKYGFWRQQISGLIISQGSNGVISANSVKFTNNYHPFFIFHQFYSLI